MNKLDQIMERQNALLGLIKYIFLFTCILTLGILAAPCSGMAAPRKKAAAPPPPPPPPNFFVDEGALTQVMRDLAARPEFSGRKIRLLQDIRIQPEAKGEGQYILLTVLRKGETNFADGYDFRAGKWHNPEPVQLKNQDDILAHSIEIEALSEVFARFPAMYGDIGDRVDELEGFKATLAQVGTSEQGPWMVLWRVKTARFSYTARFDLEGRMTGFQRD